MRPLLHLCSAYRLLNRQGSVAVLANGTEAPSVAAAPLMKDEGPLARPVVL